MITYCGWNSYATWRVNLEIFEDLDLREMGWHKLHKVELADCLKEYVEEMLEMQVEGKQGGMPLVFHYAMAFIEEVDWREIAEHMIDTYAEEEDA
jgi:hypothetical protein